jgi:hypothetical protein
LRAAVGVDFYSDGGSMNSENGTAKSFYEHGISVFDARKKTTRMVHKTE